MLCGFTSLPFSSSGIPSSAFESFRSMMYIGTSFDAREADDAHEHGEDHEARER